jgi:hypothetical protein
MTRPRSLFTLLLALACLALPATAAAETVAKPGASTTVREFEGNLVFSQYVEAEKHYRLAVRRAGAAAPELLPVAPAERQFDADIGPDSNGRPQLIYQRCDETCDLFVYSLARNTGERAVRNANDPENNDVHPTLWRGRIAWARIYGEQIDRKVVVYTKKLTTPRSQPSTRLPGVPEERCGDSEPKICGPTTGRSVDELELWGENLAEVVDYQCGGCSGTSQLELRVVRVSDRNSRPIAFQVVGLGGQWFAGPSFANGWLSWYRGCLGDPEGCRGGAAQPFRHNLKSHAYAKGAPGPISVDGFVDTMAYNIRVERCSPETSEPELNASCRIEQIPAPAYVKTSEPKR